MKLILTRPEADSLALAVRLQKLGHSVKQCPLLEIVPFEKVKLPALNFQAVCASSANGLLANLDWTRLQRLPFFAVGQQSAAAAHSRGFQNVTIAAGGTLKSLSAKIAETLSHGSGPLLYLSGDIISGDLAGLLQPHGIAVERVVVYSAVEIQTSRLSEALTDADGVLLYSARTAQLWIKAIDAEGERDRLTSLRHFCLSSAVAAQLPQSLSISIAETPNDHGMMDLLD
jgi:uroporphyrinogen-III synthase